MKPSIRLATAEDFAFAFEAKRQALGPHIEQRWPWDTATQLAFHRERWSSRPWQIIQLSQRAIGTVSVEHRESEIQFGEFYLLPEWQRQGIGTTVLLEALRKADAECLPVKLEYLKWNPVGALYQRHGFNVVAENDTHYFLVRERRVEAQPCEYQRGQAPMALP